MQIGVIFLVIVGVAVVLVFSLDHGTFASDRPLFHEMVDTENGRVWNAYLPSPDSLGTVAYFDFTDNRIVVIMTCDPEAIARPVTATPTSAILLKDTVYEIRVEKEIDVLRVVDSKRQQRQYRLLDRESETIARAIASESDDVLSKIIIAYKGPDLDQLQKESER